MRPPRRCVDERLRSDDLPHDQDGGGNSHISRQELVSCIYGLASKCLLVGKPETTTRVQTKLDRFEKRAGKWLLVSSDSGFPK
jgi:hypothetical protein